MTKPTELRVLTLNCWGIPYLNVSKLRSERIADIGEELAKRDLDIVCLQELWSYSDFEYLRDVVKEKFPYSHFFHSGVIGSGLCAFSKSPIIGTFSHAYSINGYPHMILHGDWFGGKMVGLCQIQHQGLLINVYFSHIHAEYNHDTRPYHNHRLVQYYELCQFIKFTGQNSDLNLVVGDLNARSDEIGYELICDLNNMEDAWITQINKQESDDPTLGNTCDLPSNVFTKADAQHKNGQRIDYILYQANTCKVECRECRVTMGKVPNKHYNYSDHEAVTATLSITKNDKVEPEEERPNPVPVLEEVTSQIKLALHNLKAMSYLNSISFLMSLVMTLFWMVPLYDNVKTIVLLLVSICIAYMFAMATIGIRMERKAFQGCLDSVQNELESMKKKYDIQETD